MKHQYHGANTSRAATRKKPAALSAAVWKASKPQGKERKAMMAGDPLNPLQPRSHWRESRRTVNRPAGSHHGKAETFMQCSSYSLEHLTLKYVCDASARGPDAKAHRIPHPPESSWRAGILEGWLGFMVPTNVVRRKLNPITEK